MIGKLVIPIREARGQPVAVIHSQNEWVHQWLDASINDSSAWMVI